MPRPATIGKQFFPCPTCDEGLDVRTSKNGKPYVVCNQCGVQLFVRMQPGIEKFEKIITEAQADDIWERLHKLEGAYRKKCPQCKKSFWINEGLIATSWLDGSFAGYKCPEAGCGGIVKPAEKP